MTQATLSLRPTLAEQLAAAHAHGATYDAALDQRRLSTQLLRVYALMADGQWRTLREIASAIDAASEAGTSARIRQLRNDYGVRVDSRRRGDGRKGVWEYKLQECA